MKKCCFLLGKDLTLKCYLDELRRQIINQMFCIDYFVENKNFVSLTKFKTLAEDTLNVVFCYVSRVL